MKTLIALAAVAALSSAAVAQVVFEPVRYQFGRYNEVYYGGLNPNFANNNAYIYLPPALQTAYNAQRFNGPLNTNAYAANGPGAPVYSPYAQGTSNSPASFVPYVFSDYLPYEEAGQYGYTPDDARNEAYANVPRIQYGFKPTPAPVPAPTETASTPDNAPKVTYKPDPREKAIPLLDWAKVERTKNPELYQALIQEARKYDLAKTNEMEQAFASEK